MELLSQMWSLLGLLTILQNILPSQLLALLHSTWQSLQDSLTPYSYIDVPEFLGSSAVEPNDLYRHVYLYLHQSLLSSAAASSSPPRLTLSLPRGSLAAPSLSLSPNHSLEDCFAGQRLLWTHHADTLQDSLEERRSFSLRLPKRASASLLSPYFAHLAEAADHLERSSRPRRLFTNSRGGAPSWSSVPFRHPATFATLALEPAQKESLLADLDAFAAGREFYFRTGRAWKRGYLLHGPPGSGKSSLIAAMANHLRYDVYDLELTRVANNSDLRSLLIQTNNRSVIVIEDIDCSLDLTGDRRITAMSAAARTRTVRRRRQPPLSNEGTESDDNDVVGSSRRNDARVTLSGLLNFIDGLWSCCGEERVIVFTTNYVEAFDPALLRPGRMDVHVNLGACGVHAMRELVERYVGVRDHEMLGVAESCIRVGADMTPAEVTEVLLRHREEPEEAVRSLVAELSARVAGGEGSGGEEESGAWSWEESPEKAGGKRRRAGWEKKVRFLRRLRSLTKLDSESRGV